MNTMSAIASVDAAEVRAVAGYVIECSTAFTADASGADALLQSPLCAEWEALAHHNRSLPFLRPQFVAAWWRAFATPGSQLVIWQARLLGRLAAVLPMMQQGNTLRTATNYHTPQSGILADNVTAATALLHALLKTSGASQVVLCGFDTLSPDPALVREAARAAGHRVIALTHERATYVTTQQGWEAYGKKLGKAFRGDIRRLRNNLQQLGELTLEFGAEHEPALAGRVDEALAIEAAGWKQRNGTAILTSPREARFYHELARWADSEGMLRLCFLRLDGRPLAMLYAFRNGDFWHLLKTGYDENYARYSAGKLLLHEILHHCFDTGVERIEIHGDTAAHKLRWRPQSRVLERLHIFPRNPAGTLAWLRVALRPWLKRLLISLHVLPPPAPDPLNEADS